MVGAGRTLYVTLNNGKLVAVRHHLSISPPAPDPISAEALSEESIQVDWAYSGPYSDLLTGFRIYRGPAPGGPFAEVGTVGASSRSFSESGLAPGTTYHYTVAAETAGGASPRSAATSTQTRQQTLAAPTELLAMRQNDLSVLLTWQDNASGETGYLVERKLPATNEFVPTAVLSVDAATYTDPAAPLSEGGIEYRVRAYTATNESLPAYAHVEYTVARTCKALLPLIMR